jgi:hypothetical protein
LAGKPAGSKANGDGSTAHGDESTGLGDSNSKHVLQYINCSSLLNRVFQTCAWGTHLIFLA